MNKNLSPQLRGPQVDEEYRIIGFEEKPQAPKTIPGQPELSWPTWACTSSTPKRSCGG